MNKDITEELDGAADRAGLVCTKTGNFRAAMIDSAHLRAAADEIKRLRKERDEARHGESVAIATLQGVIEERTALRAERDEARREILESLHPDVRESHAAARGWNFPDCFKEVQ